MALASTLIRVLLVFAPKTERYAENRFFSLFVLEYATRSEVCRLEEVEQCESDIKKGQRQDVSYDKSPFKKKAGVEPAIQGCL